MASTVDINGRTYNLNIEGSGAWLNLTPGEKKILMQAIVDKGAPLTVDEIIKLGVISGAGNKADTERMNSVKRAVDLMFERNKANMPVGNVEGVTDKDLAFNEYYRDLYSREEGTGGREVYDQLVQGFQGKAVDESVLADVMYQQQALQQGQVIKSITDQVRAERMARLRAGMSEAQIANQDMQMMMANVNAVHQNAQMMNQQRLQSQLNYGRAQDEAYMAYLDQVNARGQNAAAMYAADSGNVLWNTQRQMATLYGNDPTKWTKAQWEEQQQRVQLGTLDNKGGK